MFEDKELILNRTETKLLYDIRQLLIEQNALLKQLTEKPKIENNEQSKEIKPCKYCGGTHENKGQELACARKHKKDGVKE